MVEFLTPSADKRIKLFEAAESASTITFSLITHTLIMGVFDVTLAILLMSRYMEAPPTKFFPLLS